MSNFRQTKSLKRMEINFELGFLRQVFEKMYENLITMTRANVEIFVSLEDFINEYTKTKDLEIDNLSGIFFSYFIIFCLVLLTFLFNCGRHYIKRNAFKLRLWFEEMKLWLRSLAQTLIVKCHELWI